MACAGIDIASSSSISSVSNSLALLLADSDVGIKPDRATVVLRDQPETCLGMALDALDTLSLRPADERHRGVLRISETYCGGCLVG